MSQPDLFVVCKNCGSEVSPYVTECPYCGQRVRKRAPKLEREDRESEARPKVRGGRRLRLPRLRSDQIEGIAPETRPTVTLLLIAVCLVVTVVLSAGLAVSDAGGLFIGVDDAPWRYVTTPFVHDSLAYEFVTLAAVGVFGTLLERRFGALAPLLVFVVAGAAGAGAAAAVDLGQVLDSNVANPVLGANGAALGLLAAWYVDDHRATARGDDRGNDMIGVAVVAAVLVLLPLAVSEAAPVAGVVGAVAGALLGLGLPLLGRNR